MSLIAKAIEPRLRERICRLCVSGLVDDSCGLPPGVRCPLFSRLDDLIEIVDEIDEVLLNAYADRTREVICATCPMVTALRCARRDQANCALDLYLSLAIEVIEEELRLNRSRPGGWRMR